MSKQQKNEVDDKAKIEDLEKRLKSQTEANQSLTAQLTPIKKENDNLKSQLSEKIDSLEEMEKRVSDMQVSSASKVHELENENKKAQETIEALQNEIEGLKNNPTLTEDQKNNLYVQWEQQFAEELQKIQAQEAGEPGQPVKTMDSYVPESQIQVGKNKVLMSRLNNNNSSTGGFTKGMADTLKKMNEAGNISCTVRKMPKEYLPEGMSEEAQAAAEIWYVYTGSMIPVNNQYVDVKAVGNEE